MQLPLPGRPHLTYCTNIHAGETWAEINTALRRNLPAVKAAISPDAPMGVGLRLSAIAAAELEQPDTLAELQQFLADNGLYVFTINAFPYGPFHGQRVKEQVYEPDWRRPERLDFTRRVANILSKLAPNGSETSISTVPGGFKAHITTDADVEAITHALVACAAHLHSLRKTTGQTIALAIEPEPACFLETTDEAIDYFSQHLFADSAVAQFAALTGASKEDAEAALRQHIGLCFDVCHSAVEFENPDEILERVERAGIRIPKIQLSSALRVANVEPGTKAELAKFDDGVYLHQTVESRNGAITRHTDLADAFAALGRGEAGGEWRVHCHVPVFVDRFETLQSTQASLRDVLRICRERTVAPHLEVETYTWSVLPSELRQSDMTSAIVRELDWVLKELAT